MSNADFVEQYYERIATDQDYRARLLADPVAVVCEEFGYTPGPDLKIEIVEQADDTIVIMVPPKPDAGLDMEKELTRATEQVFDLLFSSGVGGFFIPDDTQKWILREIRLASQKKTDS
ncbi:nitrile hydratase subunit alpha [Rhodoblastus acidophilus]|uniref:Nitrile hydratase subunit alpha n=1 Tax=Candidatus Rhodoblastus alkanivorans TaxID=2954117 RepID=A0ABS9Z2X1_9HYPH|nr:nitrile hydratase subunit alpha [Candidatus Rhodoblastus alkanivorans]MCI4680655.1 nitrile hydratase subunit alpha [Candidatus Rhodoblastus alkanivorans]MCI4681665.1 nitrile hydratase subunit alpha [Candidatus Rhodoblastus alkanivorans]MDI4642713.1 nitrile hydratase subunit alpha [Rhodoblastus acidophilus]